MRADDEFFFDGLVDFVLGELGRYADGVLTALPWARPWPMMQTPRRSRRALAP
jgi:hypothetical protein